MKRFLAVVLCLSVAGCAASSGMMGSGTYFGFSVGTGSAPPPPRVVYEAEPGRDLVPGTSVYVVRTGDYDMFQYDSEWYLSSGGYWYSSSSYQGPFLVIDVRDVPRPVLRVPRERWRHWHSDQHASWHHDGR